MRRAGRAPDLNRLTSELSERRLIGPESTPLRLLNASDANSALVVFDAARWSARRVRPAGAGRPTLEPGRARPFRHRRPQRPDVGQDEAVGPEEPMGKRRPPPPVRTGTSPRTAVGAHRGRRRRRTIAAPFSACGCPTARPLHKGTSRTMLFTCRRSWRHGPAGLRPPGRATAAHEIDRNARDDQ